MAFIGKMLKNRRAGQEGLAWHVPNLAGPETLELTSPDFGLGTAIPLMHTAKRHGGQDISPALHWTPVPEGTAQVLVVVEDPDAPMRTPIVHCVAVLDPSVTGLDQGALDPARPADGVRLLRSTIGRGYRGPGPIKGHGPHTYVFQIFALSTPLTAPEQAKPPQVLASAGGVLARGRLDGWYERP